jgi:hypothetical protein
MKTVVMSDKYSCFCDEFQKLRYKIIPTDTINIFHEPEQKHADMQILNINQKVFLLNESSQLCQKLASYNPTVISQKTGKSYPENVLLNFLYLNNTLYGKLSVIPAELKRYCIENEIKMLNVNQGYCRCSTLVVNENAVITADTSIEIAMKNEGIEVLKISSGSILLDGFDYGFIGGASAKTDEKTVVFFGDITKHPDYKIIEKFCKKHNTEIKILCCQMPLTDIGGATILKA